MATANTDTRYNMTDEHKTRLAAGREESRVVKAYLEALAQVPRGRGRGRTKSPEALTQELVQIIEQMDTAPPLERLQLAARRNQLGQALVLAQNGSLDELEKEFVTVAKSYGERKGIPADAWKEVGVPINVLQDAGIVQRRAKRVDRSEQENERPAKKAATRRGRKPKES